MKIKINMTKRLMVVICIIVAAVSFMGGMIYKYEDYIPDYIPIVEHDYETSKFTYDFLFPVDLETASFWLDWAIDYHQYHIDINARNPEGHQGYIDMWNEIKVLFQKYENSGLLFMEINE